MTTHDAVRAADRRGETRLERKLRNLSREATSLADSLTAISDKNRGYVIGWGVLALNGWLSDVREEAAKEQARLRTPSEPSSGAADDGGGR